MNTSKPGWQTSEFWLHILVTLAMVAGAASGALPPQWAAVAVVVSQTAYSISRGLSKLGANETGAVPPPTTPQVIDATILAEMGNEALAGEVVIPERSGGEFPCVASRRLAREERIAE